MEKSLAVARRLRLKGESQGNVMSIFLSLDYLVSRAEAALGSVTKMQAGHSHYLKNMEGVFVFLIRLPTVFLPA